MSKSPTNPVAKVETLGALAILAKAGTADPVALATQAQTLQVASLRREMENTVLAMFVLGSAAIDAFKRGNPDSKITPTAVCKYLDVAPGRATTWAGWSYASVNRAIDAANVVVVNDDGTVAHVADYRAAVESKAVTTSADSAAGFVAWRGRQANPARVSNRQAGTPKVQVKAYNVSASERSKAVDALAKADLTARVVPTAPETFTFAALRAMSDADLQALAAMVAAEITRRETKSADAPAVDVSALAKMTKAQILAALAAANAA